MERLKIIAYYFQIGVIFVPKHIIIFLQKNPHGTAAGVIVVHLFIEFR